MRKIKVLIVDDSAVMRKMLTEALSGAKNIEVVGTALDPYIAANKIKKLNPDVLTLDIEMPRMDGLTFLKKIMIAQPLPVIMVSGFTDKGAEQTIKALQYGAVDFILKPRADDNDAWGSFTSELREKVLTASNSKIANRVEKGRKAAIEDQELLKKYTADIIIPKKATPVTKTKSELVVAIGASTGGTEAIAEILSNLNEDVPGIVVVQHMPEKFTEAFANRVNGMSRIFVKEAAQGDRLYKGMALIAPGNRHLILKRDGNGYWIEINDGPPVNRHRPSVDVLFRSTAQVSGSNAMGIILTGMGSDGAEGLLEMKEAGAVTVAQDEASSTVFGMPREAIKRGAADRVKNISQIINIILEINKKQSLH